MELSDLNAVAAVARAGGFREAARTLGCSASRLSEAVRRMEASLGVRLFHRTTRSVVPTEAGKLLLARLNPALKEIETKIDALVRAFATTANGGQPHKASADVQPDRTGTGDDSHLLNGPQLPGDAISQADIDALLAGSN